MKNLSFIKKPIYSWLIFFSTLWVLSVGYTAFVTLQSSDADSGKSLTSSMMQAVIGNLADLDSRVSTMSGAISSLQGFWGTVTGGIGYSGGNVGIGTTNPGTKLEINAGMNEGLRINNGTINGVVFNTNNDSMSIGTVSNHPLNLYTNNSTKAFIDSAWNMGIGTITPKAKLEVNGDFIRTIARAQGFAQADGVDSGAVAYRNLTFVKKQADTGVRITYSDGRRVKGTVAGNAGRWEVKFNSTSCANPGPVAWDIYSWPADVDFHRVDTSIGTCFGLPAGTYTIQIYVAPIAGYNASSDLYTGWNGTWSLEAEEVR